MKAYYAHCKAIYGTPQEARDVALIAKLGFEVVNPASVEVGTRFNTWLSTCWDHTDEGKMSFFLELVSLSDAVIFRALPDGSIPSGVAKEVLHAKSLGVPVLELPSQVTRRLLSLEQTREYLTEIGER